MATESYVVSQRARDKHEPHFDSTMSLPRSLHEAYRLHLSNTKHPAVNMFSCSLQAHRSCNEAIIFLYGVSGAGKSTTLNHLFNAELISTSATESATDSVIEWVSSMHSEHWLVSNLEVGFIDVPGWGDSEGRDSTNFALMQQFLSVHPILGCKVRKFYPNIVLIVFNTNDNRMFGTEASAMKMLHTLSKLGIVDKKRPNLVIVLTHVCSHSPSSFFEKLSTQSIIYQNIARSTLGVDPPVVWMENDNSYNLERKGDWTLLYDGTAQPLNLYEAMRGLMVRAGDELGKEAIRLYFDNRSSNPPKERLIVNAKLCDKKTLSSREREWVELMKIKLPSFKSTPLNSYLLDYITSHPDLAMQPNDVTGLLVALASCLPNKSDIQKKNFYYLESKLQPYLMSIKEKRLLFEAIDLNVPEIPDCIMALGRGYNLIKGTITDGQLVDISQSNSFCSFLNRFLSNSFCLLPFEANRITFGSFDSRHRDKLEELDKLKSQLISTKNFMGDVVSRTLNSLIEQLNLSIKEYVDKGRIYFWIEVGIFSVQLNFPYITISKGFCDAVESLPENPFNDFGEINSEYTDFINQYGHSVIIKANGGGIIEGDINNAYQCEKELVDIILPCLETIFDLIKDGIYWRDVMDQLPEDQIPILSELDSTCFQWLGGDQAFTSKSIKDMHSDMYLKWLNSLKQYSILFDYSFSLIPIHLLVANKYPRISESLKQAINSLLPNTESNLFHAKKPNNLDALGIKFEKLILPCSPAVESSVNPAPKALSRLKARTNTNAKMEVKDTEQIDTEIKALVIYNFPSRNLSRSLITEEDQTDTNKVTRSCFSSDSKVVLENGECINISEVVIGDSILSLDSRTNQPVYSKVYMWAHRDIDAAASFVEIHHEHGTLKLSDNHILLQGHDRLVTTASRIQTGDIVHFLQSVDVPVSSYCLVASRVTRVCHCVQKGMYCPFTVNGRIVVDGLVCSVFAVPDSSVVQFARFERLSRFAMSPFILANWLGCGDRIGLNCKIHPYLQVLLHCYYSLPKVRGCIEK